MFYYYTYIIKYIGMLTTSNFEMSDKHVKSILCDIISELFNQGW